MIGAALLGLVATANAWEQNPGGDDGAFGSWGLGARGEALGRAYGALADDAAAIYWNPAGLAALGQTEVSFAYGAPFGDVGGVNTGDAVVAKPLLYSLGEEAGGAGSWGTLAAALAFRRAGGIYEANASGLTGRTFDDADVEFYLAYAHTLAPHNAFGLALKNITRDVGDYSDSGFGIDLGFQFEPLSRLSLGAVARNVIAPNYRLKATKDTAPLTFELGCSYDLFGYATPTASIEVTREAFYDVGAGLEITPAKYVAFRAGYYTGDERPRAGVGLFLGNFRFDYAMRFGEALGDSHLASISFLWGGGPPPEDTVIPEEEGYIEFNPEEEGDETPSEEETEDLGGNPGLE